VPVTVAGLALAWVATRGGVLRFTILAVTPGEALAAAQTCGTTTGFGVAATTELSNCRPSSASASGRHRERERGLRGFRPGAIRFTSDLSEPDPDSSNRSSDAIVAAGIDMEHQNVRR
jgi:hypothetical protein